MGPKYEKPLARNLGDLIPGAKGDCKSGGSAGNLQCRQGATPDPGNPSCKGGMLADGACSQAGLTAGPQCATGGSPY
jgi:hypothetical protein